MHHFISYSSADGLDFAIWLADTLEAGPPPVPVWLDKRRMRLGEDWDEQLVQAIQTCESVLFVMTRDSVGPNSVCKQEWSRALQYKKPIIPIRLHADAEMPFRLEPRQFLDFTRDRESALARLRNHLQWLRSPEGNLQTLKYRLADARRDHSRASDPAEIQRIEDEIEQLQAQVQEEQQRIKDPHAATLRAEQSIALGIERERQPEKPASGISTTRFINPPPAVAPGYFQNRHVETQLLGEFLQDEALRLAMVVGRGGTGKTAMVCRLLKALEAGRLPDDGGQIAVDGIVYLSAVGSRTVNLPHFYADLGKLLPRDVTARLEALYKDPHISTEAQLRALLDEFPRGCVVVLLDNFEDVVDTETQHIKDEELDEALRALLNLPQHAVKVIITTRVAPRALLLEQPSRQVQIELDEGLASPYAEEVLRKMDRDGRLGLKNAADDLLAEARERTRGYPRALEALVAILRADRDTTLRKVLDDTRQILPENVVHVLVSEAFSRLDVRAQQVMQALAIYGLPVTPTAVDYLLEPFVPGVNSAPVLRRLVNMHFVRTEAGRFYLHPIDRAYARYRINAGVEDDRFTDPPPFTRFALLRRAADYFEQIRSPRTDWKHLDDLAPQLAEFELRVAGGEYDTAARLLDEIEGAYLFRWGHYRLILEMRLHLEGKLLEPELQQGNAWSLGSIYHSLGRYQEAIARFEQALAAAVAREDRNAEGSLIDGIGRSFASLGQYDRAIDCHQAALTLAREIGDRLIEADALNGLGYCYAERGDYTDAINCYTDALRIARQAEGRVAEIGSLSGLGDGYASLGYIDQAIDYHRQALAISRQIGDREMEAGELGSLGNRYSVLGQTTGAVEYYEQALAISREIGHRTSEGIWLANLADCYSELGQNTRALSAGNEALEIARETGHRRLEGRVLDRLASILVDLERHEEAVQHAAAGIRIADEIGNPEVGSNNGEALSLAYLYGGDLERARLAAETAQRYDVPANNHEVQSVLGVVALRQSESEVAQAAFQSAIAQADVRLAHAPHDYHALDSKALAFCGLGLCGEPDRLSAAAEAFRAARAINRDTGVVARVLRLLDALAVADPAGISQEVRRAANGASC